LPPLARSGVAFKASRDRYRAAALAEWDPGIGAPVIVRLSSRACRMALRIDEARRVILLVLPSGVPLRQGLRFLEHQRGWLLRQIAALPPPEPFVEGALVPVLGRPHRIRREFDPAAPAVAIADGEIRVRGDPAHLARRVRDHLIATARRELGRRARGLAARLGRKVTRIRVGDPASHWGSCSAAGSLSFSWRLILAPEPVLDYVVAHEVAHLSEMNHGPSFWRLVETLSPDSAVARDWLRRHRGRLLSYG
jgi:predicted metal-dependent hydrolase